MMEQQKKYLLIDLEGTCGPGIKHNLTEIIEIGACIATEDGDIIDKVSYFVKPTENVNLTPFCVKLTSITQSQIDESETLDVILPKFDKWVSQYDVECWGSWGMYDSNQFLRECKRKNISLPYFYRNLQHTNFKNAHKLQHNLEIELGLKAACNVHKIVFEGTHHRGVDDATMVGKLLPYIL